MFYFFSNAASSLTCIFCFNSFIATYVYTTDGTPYIPDLCLFNKRNCWEYMVFRWDHIFPISVYVITKIAGNIWCSGGSIYIRTHMYTTYGTPYIPSNFCYYINRCRCVCVSLCVCVYVYTLNPKP